MSSLVLRFELLSVPASHSINLLVKNGFDKTTVGKLLRWALTYGRYIIISTEIVVLMAFIYRFTLDRKITDLNDEITQKTAILEANQQFEQQFRYLQNRVGQIGTLFAHQDAPIQILKHLEQITPQGISFITFSFAKDAVAIDAQAATNWSLNVFLSQLKNSPLLTRINLITVTKKSAGTGAITFHIDADFKKE